MVISAVDQFAKHARMQREVTKLEARMATIRKLSPNFIWIP